MKNFCNLPFYTFTDSVNLFILLFYQNIKEIKTNCGSPLYYFIVLAFK